MGTPWGWHTSDSTLSSSYAINVTPHRSSIDPKIDIIFSSYRASDTLCLSIHKRKPIKLIVTAPHSANNRVPIYTPRHTLTRRLLYAAFTLRTLFRNDDGMTDHEDSIPSTGLLRSDKTFVATPNSPRKGKDENMVFKTCLPHNLRANTLTA
jgi:hypothetical protein